MIAKLESLIFQFHDFMLSFVNLQEEIFYLKTTAPNLGL